MTVGVPRPRSPLDTFPLDNSNSSPGYSDYSFLCISPIPDDMLSEAAMQPSRLRRKGSVKNLRNARLMYENLYTGPPPAKSSTNGRMSSSLQDERLLQDLLGAGLPPANRRILHSMRNVPFNIAYLTPVVDEREENHALSNLIAPRRRRSLRGRYPSRSTSVMAKLIEEEQDCGGSVSSHSRSDSTSTHESSESAASASTLKTTPGTTVGVFKPVDEEESEIDDGNESLNSDEDESGDDEEVASPEMEVPSNSLGVSGIDVTSSLNELVSGAEVSPSRAAKDLHPAQYHMKMAEGHIHQPRPEFPPTIRQPVPHSRPLHQPPQRDIRFSAETQSSATRRVSRKSSRPNLRAVTSFRRGSAITDSYTLSPQSTVKPREPLPIFVYGDLVDPLLLSLLLTGVPNNGGRINKQRATLYGFERRTMKQYNYPAAVPARPRYRRGQTVIYDEAAHMNGVLLRDLNPYQRQKIKQFYPVILGSEQDQRMALFVRTRVRVTLEDESRDEIDAIAYTWNEHRIGGPVIEFELQPNDLWNSDEFKRNSLDAYLTISAEDQFRVPGQKGPPMMVSHGKLKKISSQQSGFRTKLIGLSKRR
ncbi:hypothetical protein FRC02_011828 [Tulasnella sp. 418]|nr:hypothetical protein FRC02_011828 [Tulasnella sp. 418]